MKYKPLISLVLLLLFFTIPVYAEGEENVKIVKSDGTNTTSGIQKSSSSDNFFNIDTSNYDIIDYLFNFAASMSIFEQFTPLKLLVVFVSSIVVTVVFFIVIMAFLIALGKLGVGTMHWDAKKGWKMIEHNKAAMVVLFIAVFASIFFSSCTYFFFKHGFTILGGL